MSFQDIQTWVNHEAQRKQRDLRDSNRGRCSWDAHTAEQADEDLKPLISTFIICVLYGCSMHYNKTYQLKVMVSFLEALLFEEILSANINLLTRLFCLYWDIDFNFFNASTKVSSLLLSLTHVLHGVIQDLKYSEKYILKNSACPSAPERGGGECVHCV